MTRVDTFVRSFLLASVLASMAACSGDSESPSSPATPVHSTPVSIDPDGGTPEPTLLPSDSPSSGDSSTQGPGPENGSTPSGSAPTGAPNLLKGRARDGGGAPQGTVILRGRVVGLRGHGLVLSNLGQSQTHVEPDEPTFAVGPSLNPGDTYALTVKVQPTSPDQTCTPSGSGRGTVPASGGVEIEIVCR